MELLQASPAERECLELSGVAKIKAKRRPYDADAFRSELCSIDATLASGGEEGTELRLLELQSELWWALRQPGAINLFRAAHIVYARFLLTWSRYHEAMEQSQAALESGEKWDDELGVAANRVLARADVYRWASPRPHLGLYVLQPLLHSLTEAQLRAPVLTEMSEYSRLAGRSSESLNYALRAVAVAGKLADSEVQFFAALALGLAHAAQQEPVRAFELLADAPTDTEPERAWRMIARSEAHRRIDQTSEALRAYEDAQQFLSNHNLNHLQPALERAKEVVPGSIS
jgi:tetratricopeptide (TPR) repeat protein